MKRTEQFKRVFGNMKVDAPKKWDITVSRAVHKDKKKEANKYACRGKNRW